jgi:uncharacterized protein YacL
MRGRKGLDIVNELQNIDDIAVEISRISVKELEVESVDSALLALGKRLGATVLTTDITSASSRRFIRFRY